MKTTNENRPDSPSLASSLNAGRDVLKTAAHTPEPWIMHADSVRFPFVVQNAASQCLLETGQNGYIDPATHKANAERIVSCVNACSGMADPAAEIKALREALTCIANQESGDLGDIQFRSYVSHVARAALNGGKAVQS